MSDRIEEKYNELLMAVKTKYQNETRHETALRYIKQVDYKNPLDNGKKNVVMSDLTPVKHVTEHV